MTIVQWSYLFFGLAVVVALVDNLALELFFPQSKVREFLIVVYVACAVVAGTLMVVKDLQ